MPKSSTDVALFTLVVFNYLIGCKSSEVKNLQIFYLELKTRSALIRKRCLCFYKNLPSRQKKYGLYSIR